MSLVVISTPTPHEQSPSAGLEECPRCVQGRIGKARLTCTLCFGAALVQPWVADQERAQQASWAAYLAARRRTVPDGADPDLGECARCWPSRCPQCPWSPPDPGADGLGLAA